MANNEDKREIILIKNQKKWDEWLNKKSKTSQGIWLQIAKKGTGIETVTYEEALETALCYGWIDGQKDKYDEKYWLQKFTQRKNNSIWSKRNRDKAEELIKQGKMKEPGLEAVGKAKKNGRWDGAYDSQNKAELPYILKKELDNNPKAKKFFESLNSVNKYAIIFRTQTAKKEETRIKRVEKFIKMLEKGEKLHP